MKAPRRDRPNLPDGYISKAPRGMLSWAATERLLKTFTYLWLATGRRDGAPHLVQQWGVWVGGALYFDGSEETLWARNIARRPRIAFGVAVGDRAAYGDAAADLLRKPDHALSLRIARAYGAKYGKTFKYRPTAGQYEGGYVFRARPRRIVAFDVRKFGTSAARFTFAED